MTYSSNSDDHSLIDIKIYPEVDGVFYMHVLIGN